MTSSSWSRPNYIKDGYRRPIKPIVTLDPKFLFTTCGSISVLADRECVLLKTAKELVREIGLAVQPPQGVAIVLTEQPGALPNWVAAAGIMEVALTVKFSEKVAELMNTDPNVDWGEMDQGPGEARRVVTFLSEETD
jgi:hypothetical protein